MRVCTECGESLAGRHPQTKTCSTACRAKRSRRLKRQVKENSQNAALPEHLQEVAKSVRKVSPDLVRPVIEEELRPVVREAITEEVLQSVRRLLGLAPRVVELIAQDLESDDAVLRQRAYTLVSKYTIGHPSLLRPEDTTGEKQLVVNFAMPRPDKEPVIETSAVELELGDDFRQCDLCGADKPLVEFVAGSHRCSECFEKQRDQARALGAGNAD